MMKNSTYQRDIVITAFKALTNDTNWIHIIVGPRQTGKTTASLAIKELWHGPSHYAAGDLPLPPGPEWIETHWELARRDAGPARPVLLILDEVQKVRGWSETVKRLWDEDKRRGARISVLLLGSSALLLVKGLSESLAGRFFLHHCTHWTWPECKKAFGWDPQTWIYFGGYPGSAPLIKNELKWKQYITDSLIETVLARDVLQLQTVTKPALLRNIFLLAAGYPAQILSYNKMLGQLHDAGNTTTIAHYIKLLETAFLISGLGLYSEREVRRRSSSPKLVLWNNALVSSLDKRNFNDAMHDTVWWGRLVENAVGAHLLNCLTSISYSVSYWRHRNIEVDFVVSGGKNLWAIEVKSGSTKISSGLPAFKDQNPGAKTLMVGGGGMPLEEFFSTPPEEMFG